MKFQLLLIKRKLEDILMFPLILLGRLFSFLKPLDKEYQVFFIFPFYHTGGAEKVHALITKAAGNQNCIIFFTKKSHNDAFFSKFMESGCLIKDISRYTDNKWIYFINIIYRGIIAGYINKQQLQPVVFNGQSNFGYKISPWVSKRIKQIELIHSISNFSYIRIPFLQFISKTVMISQQKIDEHLTIYKQFGIPCQYAQRIHYIPNASEFENIDIETKDFSITRVLYSGRSTIEKRTHLVAKIAEEVYRNDQNIQFSMAGDGFANLDRKQYPFIHFHGNISNDKTLAALYKKSNILLITSSTEGFPLAIIEGMAYGCVVVGTPVGDIPLHVKNNENGFLFSSVGKDEIIIQEATAFILRLNADKKLLCKMASNNIKYAQANFSLERFAASYQKIIFS